eukprot:6201594-Pleurochrysis_carterae.AAC.1
MGFKETQEPREGLRCTTLLVKPAGRKQLAQLRFLHPHLRPSLSHQHPSDAGNWDRQNGEHIQMMEKEPTIQS